jgi:hypothetical protein
MPTIAATVTHATNTQQNPFAHGTDTLIMEPAASRPSMVMQHNIRSTESHELPEASFWRSADTRHCRSAFVCLWRLCQVGICKSAGERENRTRELEEPVSGPSRRPALEAPQPQTGGGSARERENVSRANVSGCLWIALDFVGSG